MLLKKLVMTHIYEDIQKLEHKRLVETYSSISKSVGNMFDGHCDDKFSFVSSRWVEGVDCCWVQGIGDNELWARVTIGDICSGVFPVSLFLRFSKYPDNLIYT